MEAEPEMGIGMPDFYSNLLLYASVKSLYRFFSRFGKTAGKFPERTEQAPGMTLDQQDAATGVPDDGRDGVPDGHAFLLRSGRKSFGSGMDPGETVFTEGTGLAQGFTRPANRRPKLHQGLIEIPGQPQRQNRHQET